MTDDQEKAIEILKGITAKRSEIQREIWRCDDDIDHSKGKAKWAAIGKKEKLEEIEDYLDSLDNAIETAFSLGWECTESHEWDILSGIVPMLASTRTMKRADGSVRYDNKITVKGEFTYKALAVSVGGELIGAGILNIEEKAT